MNDEYKDWIEKAERDFSSANYNIEGGLLEEGAFFLQQSSEKALKALYIKRFKRLFRTHDLVVLAKGLKAPKEIVEFSKKLSPAYQYTRYPDIVKKEELESEINNLKNYSEEILKWVKKSL